MLADSLQEAVALVNDYAPEHLEVILKDESVLPELVNLALFLLDRRQGKYSEIMRQVQTTRFLQ